MVIRIVAVVAIALALTSCDTATESVTGLRDRITDIDIDATLDGLRDCDRLSEVFVGVVSDSLWQRFCAEFELTEFAGDPEMERNNERVKHRDTIIPHLQALFAQMSKEQ